MNLKDALKKRILEEMIGEVRKTCDFVILVVDSKTSKILSSCVRVYDVMEAGVLVVQNLEVGREKLPDTSAIYFIEPSASSVKYLVDDFANPARPAYKAAHLFFTNHVQAAEMKMLAGSKAIPRVKSFVELNADFSAVESSVFSLNLSNSLGALYFHEKNKQEVLANELSQISKKLTSMCLTMHELPHVRYCATKEASGINKVLASFFEKDMKALAGKVSDWKTSESRERGTILLLDRSMDPVAPLMHEYTYQAMVNDLLEVKGELCDVNTDADKKETIVLSEDDQLWVEFRHQHIANVMKSISAKFRSFQTQNNLVKLQKAQTATVKDMISAMKDFPKYKAMMKKYHEHMSLAEDCMKQFSAGNLKDISEFEQDMATGLDGDNNKVAAKTLKANLIKFCQDPEVGVLQKLRLLMIFIASQGGIQEATRNELLKSVDVKLHKAVMNLGIMGPDKSKSYKKKKTKGDESELMLVRFTPLLHQVILDFASGNLSEKDYPYSGIPPIGTSGKKVSRSVRSARKAKKWRNAEKEEDSKQEETRPLLTVFISGCNFI